MIVYEDHCCCCDTRCLGRYCERRNVPVHYCDGCGALIKSDSDEEYELCADCREEGE